MRTKEINGRSPMNQPFFFKKKKSNTKTNLKIKNGNIFLATKYTHYGLKKELKRSEWITF